MDTKNRLAMILACVTALSVAACAAPTTDETDSSTEETVPPAGTRGDEDTTKKEEDQSPAVDVDTIHLAVPKQPDPGHF